MQAKIIFFFSNRTPIKVLNHQQEHTSRSQTPIKVPNPFQHIFFIYALTLHSKNVQHYKGSLLLPRSQSQPIPIPISRPNTMNTVCWTLLAITSTDLQFLLPDLLQSSSNQYFFQRPLRPHIEQNNFQIMDTKNINAFLILAYCGVQQENSCQLWSLC